MIGPVPPLPSHRHRGQRRAQSGASTTITTDGVIWRGARSPAVNLRGENRGADFPLHEIEVLSRIGLDLDPIDPGDIDSRIWLDALIWPEQVERRQRLRAALDLVAGIEIHLRQGDALETLPRVLSGLPDWRAGGGHGRLLPQPASPSGRAADRADRREGPLQREVFPGLDGATRRRRRVGKAGGSRRNAADRGRPSAHPHGEWVEIGRLRG